MNFSELGLAPAQLRACESLGYTEPTPIQNRAIPIVLNGQDLIGCAETGTGKTAAFLLPIIQRISEKPRPGVRVLVLAPTRELALQIQKNYVELNNVKSNRSVIVIGGANIRTQISEVRRGVAVVIATPGRLLDLQERGALNLNTVEVLVLDEADRMLDMGFLPAIRRVLAMLPTKRQTLLFSATMSSSIEQLARSTMKEPKLIEVNTRGQAATMVEQTAYPVAQESKTALLLDLLERPPRCRASFAHPDGPRSQRESNSRRPHATAARSCFECVSRRSYESARGHRYRRARIGCRVRFARHQLRCAGRARRLCASSWPYRPGR